MRRTATTFVPRLLHNEHKQHRLEICNELQQKLEEVPVFLSWVVTGTIPLLSLPQDEN
jgi:hypothetical protein